MRFMWCTKMNVITCFNIQQPEKNYSYRGGSRIFFRRGCSRVLLYFNTNKPRSFFFWQNTSCTRKQQVISGGGGAHPLHPPPISAPVLVHFYFVQRSLYDRICLYRWQPSTVWLNVTVVLNTPTFSLFSFLSLSIASSAVLLAASSSVLPFWTFVRSLWRAATWKQ